MIKPRISIFTITFILLGGLVLLFIVGPLLSMVLHTSSPKLFEAIKDETVQSSIFRTLWISFLGTLFFSLFSIPLAYLLARKKFVGKRIINGIIDIPIVIPHSAAGIAVLGFISRDTFLGKIGESVGINFVGSSIGIALAMAFVSIPFLINATRDGFKEVPIRYEKAAMSLGASPVKVFFTISVPLAIRSIISGFVLMFGRGMSEFGAVVIVAYYPMTAPVLIYQRFSEFGLQAARPISVLFIFFSFLFFIGLRIISNKSDLHD